MRVCVCGSRDFMDYEYMKFVLSSFRRKFDEVIEIVSGCARGADSLGERFASEEGLKCHRFPANWERDGKKAGFLRNHRMAEFSDVIIAFWDGESRGTKHMIDLCKRMGKKVYVVKI